MIEYKNLVLDRKQIKNLYLENKWYTYTNDFDNLIEGIRNSTDVIGAYDGDLLVGLVRTISDKTTVCHIQDILILDNYKRKGIGTKLITQIIEKYKELRQVILITDDKDEISNRFYKKLGMVEYKERNCIGYIVKKQDN